LSTTKYRSASFIPFRRNKLPRSVKPDEAVVVDWLWKTAIYRPAANKPSSS
jgi:hypothetical protein